MARSCSYICREKDKSRIRVVQMDNFRGFLGIRRMDRVVPSARIRELYEVTKVFSDGSAMLRGGRTTGLLRGSM